MSDPLPSEEERTVGRKAIEQIRAEMKAEYERNSE